jgi:hypothetical protein
MPVIRKWEWTRKEGRKEGRKGIKKKKAMS